MLACVCQPADPTLFKRGPIPLGTPPLKFNNAGKGAIMGTAGQGGGAGAGSRSPRPGRIYRIPVITSEPKNSKHLAQGASATVTTKAPTVFRAQSSCGSSEASSTSSSSASSASSSSSSVSSACGANKTNLVRRAKVERRERKTERTTSESMCVVDCRSSSVSDCNAQKKLSEERCCADSQKITYERTYDKLPDGVQLTLSELRDMACRQQAQIESQHQLLAAKEQRLRYLKEQEARQQRVQAESERLRRLRDRVDAQELKLRKLRAIRGQVDHQKQNNISFTSDLDSIRALFNEKEKELSLAVAKVDELTKQLEELRRGRTNREQTPASALELDKLRRELMYRNKLNEQQNHRLNQQREALTARQEEMSAIDKRISELQERLHRKRLLNQQLANQISAASHKAAYNQFVRLSGSTDQNNQHYPRKNQQNNTNGLPRNNIAAVEPYNHVPHNGGQQMRHGQVQDNTTYHPVYQQNIHIKNDSESKNDSHDVQKLYKGEDSDLLKDFDLSKSDPKYQTLPYNTKFTVNLLSNKTRIENQDCLANQQYSDGKDVDSQNGNTTIHSQMVHSAPMHVLNKNVAMPLNSIDLANKRNEKDELIKNFQNGQTTNKLSEQGSSLYQKPISSVAPTSIHHTSKLSNIYQTSSIKVQPVEPQTISTKPSNSLPVPLSPPQSTSTPVGTPEVIGDKTAKPALPPKPFIKPPPRQTTQASIEEARHSPPPPPVPLSEPPEDKVTRRVDSAHPLSLALNKLQGNFSQMTVNTTGQKGLNSSPLIHSPLSQSSPVTNSPVLQHSPVTHSPVLQHTPQLPNSSPNIDNMPIIKAKPLTIKKQMLSEQPKLRALSSHSRHNGMNTRRIEMPPAFHFPELEKSEVNGNEISAKLSSSSDETDKSVDNAVPEIKDVVIRRNKKGNLKQTGKVNLSRRVSFDPLALLLDASLEGELELVKKTATQVANPSAANDEGITALHNAICAGHLEIVKFLVEFGCDVNAQDSDGWTPLHCAASCNNVAMVRFLVEHGACIFATTLSDHETAAEKCEEDEEGFDGCSEYLYSVQEKLGILSGGAVFAVFDYNAQQPDELSFNAGQQLTVLRKGDESEREWWWSRLGDKEGYIPRNLLGLYPRVSKPDE